MVPLWQRKKADVKKEEYDEFYQQRFADSQPPLSVITVSAEGAVTYKALLFIPEKAPLRYYSRGVRGRAAAVLRRRDDHGQVQGAAARVLQLCPRCGGVPDLNLNISVSFCSTTAS